MSDINFADVRMISIRELTVQVIVKGFSSHEFRFETEQQLGVELAAWASQFAKLPPLKFRMSGPSFLNQLGWLAAQSWQASTSSHNQIKRTMRSIDEMRDAVARSRELVRESERLRRMKCATIKG